MGTLLQTGIFVNEILLFNSITKFYFRKFLRRFGWSICIVITNFIKYISSEYGLIASEFYFRKKKNMYKDNSIKQHRKFFQAYKF